VPIRGADLGVKRGVLGNRMVQIPKMKDELCLYVKWRRNTKKILLKKKKGCTHLNLLVRVKYGGRE